MSEARPRVCISPALGVYVIADADGQLYSVPDRAGGWRRREPYLGLADDLIEVSPRVATAIAARLGAVRATRNPRGGRPGAPPPPAIRVRESRPAPDPVAVALAAYLEAEARLEEALAALRAAEEVVATARRRFADAVRFLQGQSQRAGRR
jgi:hypothetical protein